jgi:hypothetical protein
MKRSGLTAVGMLLGVAALGGQTLHVGPGRQYAKPSEAMAAAKDGDTVEIDAVGNYDGDVCYVRVNDITIRGVGAGRAVLDAQGKSAGSKGIFVTTGKNITVENIDFRNAGGEVNAAGIRAEGEDLTVRNCRFHDCRDAILGGAGDVLIEHSEFSYCGHNSDPATHNLYMSQRVRKLTYRFNYSHHVREGHLLKSRAAENLILYNRLTDEDGTGSAVADFPNGGVVIMIGNVLHKGRNAQNNRVVTYGMEGVKHATNALYAVNNTMIWENRREWAFVWVQKAPAGFVPVLRNNLCVGALPLTNLTEVEESGNLLFKSAAEAGFVDAAGFDFHLKPGSPCINGGGSPGKAGDMSLEPVFQYVHPAKGEPRKADGKPDVGAFEYVGGR